MAFTPGTRILVTRTHATGRIGHITGTVDRDYEYGLVIRDEMTGNRSHLATDPADLAKVGITQTISLI